MGSSSLTRDPTLAFEAVLTTEPPAKYCFTFKKKNPDISTQTKTRVQWVLWSRRPEATARCVCSVRREAQVWARAKVSGSQGR